MERLERFGNNSGHIVPFSVDQVISKIINSLQNVDKDKIAKRLERFGKADASVLDGGVLNSKDAMNKRAERFKNEMSSGEEVMNKREKQMIERKNGKPGSLRRGRKFAKIQNGEGRKFGRGRRNSFGRGRGRRGGFENSGVENGNFRGRGRDRRMRFRGSRRNSINNGGDNNINPRKRRFRLRKNRK